MRTRTPLAQVTRRMLRAMLVAGVVIPHLLPAQGRGGSPSGPVTLLAPARVLD